MTPEQLTAVLSGIAVLVVAVGGLIKSISSARAEIKEARDEVKGARVEVGEVLEKVVTVEHATNSAATAARMAKEALEATVADLKEQLAAAGLRAVEVARVSERSAADVQAAIKAPPPQEE